MPENIREALLESGKNYPSPFKEKRGNIFLLDFLVAKRKAFLNVQKLTYSARLRADEQSKQVKFFEILKESGAGLGSGGADDFGPGFGFKVEKVRIKGKEREGTIKEQSVLFGKKYNYEFDFKKVREDIKEIATRFGYSFELVLTERGIR